MGLTDDVAEASYDAIKPEGGAEMADPVSGIVTEGIPTMGALGLNP